MRWRRPRSGAYVWVALVLLVVITALGPAPVIVPTVMAAVLMAVYAAMYGPWGWKRSPSWLRATAPVTRAIAWYGYGDTRAELVLRPHLAWRVVLWPLLPWTMFCRVEVREGEVVGFGCPAQQGPVVIDASTALSIANDQGLAAPFYRVLTVSHPSGGRIRLTLVVWSNWRQLARIVDPYNRAGLTLVDWPVEPFDDDGVDQDDIRS